jgi:hypothetical protein
MAKDLEVALRLRIEGNNVVVAGLDGVDKKLGSLKKGSSDLAGAFKSLLPAIGMIGIIKFFTDCVKAAEGQSEALRKLKLELDAQGEKTAAILPILKNYADVMGETTRFGQSEYLKILPELIRKQGDWKQALALSTLTANIASASGKDLSQVSELLTNALANPTRGTMVLRREFGAVVEGSKDVEDMMVKLQEHFNNVAVSEESLTKKTALLKNEWDKTQETIGKSTVWSDMVMGAISVEKYFATLVNSIQKIIAFFTPGTIKEKMDAINKLTKEGADIWVKIEKDKTFELIEQMKIRANKAKESEEKRSGLEKKGAEERAEFAKNEEDKIEEWSKNFDKNAEERAKIKADSEEAQRQLDLAADKKFLDDKTAAESEYYRIKGEAYAKSMEIGRQYAEIEKTLIEDLISGSQDAWKKFYKAMIDMAFAGAEAKMTANAAQAWSDAFLLLANPITAFYAPTAFGAAASVSAQLAGLELLKGLFKLPAMAEGGIIKGSAGGRVVIAGEGGQDEAIIPLNKGISRPIVINIYGYASTEMAQELYRKIKQLENTGGL